MAEAYFDVNPTDAEIKAARYALWEMGCLEWKLDISQLDIYKFFHDRKDKVIVVNASRRLGKTYALVIMAFEQCLQQERSVVKFIQPEVKMIRTNVRPIIDEILVDCPMHLAPTYNSQDNIYRFPNGSQIQLAGTDNGNYMKIRGGNGHLIIIDEAGFCSDLQHMINYVLIPTTTLTKGRIILSSTTPPQPDHEFNEYMDVAEIEGRFIRKTIYDALEDNKRAVEPRITKEIIQEIIGAIPGGEDSDAFRTEYLCERITNSDDSVVGEFTQDVQKQTVVEWRRPVFCDKYVSMDIGFKDLTVILFGYYDFESAVLVIEDEIKLKGQEVSAATVSKLVKAKEKELWTNEITGEIETPYMRVADNNLIFLNDLRNPPYNLNFMATEKHNKDAYINQMKIMIGDFRIIIHPRCKTLVSHLTNATWDKTRKDYKRSADNGHYDGVDALAYLVRNLNQSHNPFPPGYHMRKLQSGAYFANPNATQTNVNPQLKAFDNMFKPKSSFRKK
jgi:Terminase large subunit, T4likevirus-type, N-terminal